MYGNSCRIINLIALLFVFCTASCISAQEGEKKPSVQVHFNRDIKPLFSSRCYQCHGPDESSREGGFRLDLPESALAEADSGESPIVPGDADASQLFYRISVAPDDSDLMPPEESHKPRLTEEEISTIRAWIDAGAKFEKHWSLVAPIKATLPNSDWGSQAIDKFLFHEMQQHQLQPSPPASREKLMRRLTLDLTGLPPTLDEVDAFLADTAPDAYEKIVDRLLQSPRYGEHMARFWLDAVRYGDTHGMHFDNYREIWPYRDWVILAFNSNMDWATFTTKQIAGDLLPSPTTDDLIASGYNRLHVSTNEGGTIQEEIYVRNVVDRVSTTGTVFMGLSVGCAQCHDHKFDPLTAKDFYSLFAFFNNLDANPMDGNAAQYPPIIRCPTPESKKQLAELSLAIKDLESKKNRPTPQSEELFANWKEDWQRQLPGLWRALEVSQARSINGSTLTIGESDDEVQASGENPDKDVYEITFRSHQKNLSAIRLELLLGKSGRVGRASNGNAVLSEFELEMRPLQQSESVVPPAEFQPVTLIHADADYSQAGYSVEKAIDGAVDLELGWAIDGHRRQSQQAAIFTFAQPSGFDEGTEIRVRLHFQSQFAQHSFEKIKFSVSSDSRLASSTFRDWKVLGPIQSSDGQAAYHHDYGPESADPSNPVTDYTIDDQTYQWKRIPDFIDGKAYSFSDPLIGATYLYRKIKSPDARDLELSLGSDDAVKVWLNNQLVHENNVARGVAADHDLFTVSLRSGENDLLIKVVNFGGASGIYFSPKNYRSLTPNAAIQSILAMPNQSYSDSQTKILRNYYRNFDPVYRQWIREIETLQSEQVKIESNLPTTLVMKERAKPKPAYLLLRGQYDQPDKELGPLPRAVPSFLPQLPDDAPQNRLGLAQWLVASENPLMARVTVNRFWQQLMGKGIVSTSDDFGSQGTPPTHPELLDWLAVDFRDQGWDVKKLIKQVVTSEAYKQDSAISAEQYALDPTNKWLARGSRFRLDAEALRDQALAVSGLLYNKLGGPGVKPPQPPGIWKAVAYVGSNTQVFQADSGHEGVHRRSIYTFWKRTAPPPEMSIFDAPTREECVVSRERTNNPLQALLLLNDPQYFEAARHLAERVLRELPDRSVDEKLAHLFRLATLRKLSEDESAVLVQTFTQQLAVFIKNQEAAKKLLTVGEFPIPTLIAASELAAWTVVANVVLNLDEIINRE